MKVETTPAAASSHAMVERIEHYVQSRTNGMVQDLSVAVFDDEIVLLGRAHNYYTKQLATHAVLGAAPGMALTNDIEVC